MSVVIRGGHPIPIRGTAPAVPGGPLTEDADLLPFHYMVDCPTVWLRIENLGANTLRVFFDKPPLDPAAHKNYIEIFAKSTTEDGYIEGLYEADNLWIMGDGGATAFQVLAGRRVI